MSGLSEDFSQLNSCNKLKKNVKKNVLLFFYFLKKLCIFLKKNSVKKN